MIKAIFATKKHEQHRLESARDAMMIHHVARKVKKSGHKTRDTQHFAVHEKKREMRTTTLSMVDRGKHKVTRNSAETIEADTRFFGVWFLTNTLNPLT